MGFKKGLGSLFGFAAVVGAVAVVVKYLADYTDFKEKAKQDFRDIEGDTDNVKEAAKRTYTSLTVRDKEEIKSAAKDLAGAAGKVAVDAGSITVTAGQTAADHVKETYSKYKEDPESTKAEVIDNFKGLTKDMSEKFSSVSQKVIDKVKNTSPSEVLSGIKNSVSDKVEAFGNTVSDFKEEYRKNLSEIEADSARKKAEINGKLSADLEEEAKKHAAVHGDEDMPGSVIYEDDEAVIEEAFGEADRLLKDNSGDNENTENVTDGDKKVEAASGIDKDGHENSGSVEEGAAENNDAEECKK